MGFNLKKRKGFVKKLTTKNKIQFLEDNLAVVENQRSINAIEGIGGMFRKNKEISEDQETYLDILVDNVRRVRGIA